MTTDAGQDLVSGVAWSRFCDRLKLAGERLLAEDFPGTSVDRAEGYRHLTRLLTFALDWAVESNDPEFPVFTRTNDDRIKWGGMNADNRNLRARIDGRGSYRMVGNVGQMHDFLVTLKQGDMQLGTGRTFAEASSAELATDGEGNIEILLSGERPLGYEGNWMPLEATVSYVMIRQYFYDWESEQAGWFAIEKLGNEGRAPERPDPARLAGALDEAATWVEGTLTFWNDYQLTARGEEVDNQLGRPHYVQDAPAAINYGNGFFDLGEGEALLVEVDEPQARYWSVQLYDLGWFESLDFANRTSSLNGAQVHLDDDGRCRLVVAAEDPGVLNWLDTAGHRQGMILYRWVWPTSSEIPQPHSRVVRIDTLDALLPPGTARVSPSERAATIRRRRIHVMQRYHR